MFGYLLIRAAGKLPRIIQASFLIAMLLICGSFFVSCTYFAIQSSQYKVPVVPGNSAVLPEAGGGGATTGTNAGPHLRLHAPHMNPGFRGGGGYNGARRR